MKDIILDDLKNLQKESFKCKNIIIKKVVNSLKFLVKDNSINFNPIQMELNKIVYGKNRDSYDINLNSLRRENGLKNLEKLLKNKF